MKLETFKEFLELDQQDLPESLSDVVRAFLYNAEFQKAREMMTKLVNQDLKGNDGKLKQTIEFHAAKAAGIFKHVKAKELAQIFNDSERIRSISI